MDPYMDIHSGSDGSDPEIGYQKYGSTSYYDMKQDILLGDSESPSRSRRSRESDIGPVARLAAAGAHFQKLLDTELVSSMNDEAESAPLRIPCNPTLDPIGFWKAALPVLVQRAREDSRAYAALVSSLSDLMKLSETSQLVCEIAPEILQVLQSSPSFRSDFAATFDACDLTFHMYRRYSPTLRLTHSVVDLVAKCLGGVTLIAAPLSHTLALRVLGIKFLEEHGFVRDTRYNSRSILDGPPHLLLMTALAASFTEPLTDAVTNEQDLINHHVTKMHCVGLFGMRFVDMSEENQQQLEQCAAQASALLFSTEWSQLDRKTREYGFKAIESLLSSKVAATAIRKMPSGSLVPWFEKYLSTIAKSVSEWTEMRDQTERFAPLWPVARRFALILPDITYNSSLVALAEKMLTEDIMCTDHDAPDDEELFRWVHTSAMFICRLIGEAGECSQKFSDNFFGEAETRLRISRAAKLTAESLVSNRDASSKPPPSKSSRSKTKTNGDAGASDLVLEPHPAQHWLLLIQGCMRTNESIIKRWMLQDLLGLAAPTLQLFRRTTFFPACLQLCCVLLDRVMTGRDTSKITTTTYFELIKTVVGGCSNLGPQARDSALRAMMLSAPSWTAANWEAFWFDYPAAQALLGFVGAEATSSHAASMTTLLVDSCKACEAHALPFGLVKSQFASKVLGLLISVSTASLREPKLSDRKIARLKVAQSMGLLVPVLVSRKIYSQLCKGDKEFGKLVVDLRFSCAALNEQSGGLGDNLATSLRRLDDMLGARGLLTKASTMKNTDPKAGHLPAATTKAAPQTIALHKRTATKLPMKPSAPRAIPPATAIGTARAVGRIPAARATISVPRCQRCSKTAEEAHITALYLCGRCSKATFCSRDCQVAFWSQHKAHCVKQK